MSPERWFELMAPGLRDKGINWYLNYDTLTYRFFIDLHLKYVDVTRHAIEVTPDPMSVTSHILNTLGVKS